MRNAFETRYSETDPGEQWFVMRDLKRPNASKRAWEELMEKGFEVYTPLRWKLFSHMGRQTRKLVPVIGDLLFVKASREELDPVVAATSTLQYRFLKNFYLRPMTVGTEEMERFIRATADTDKVRYFSPGELSAGMKGQMIRVIGGPLDGYEGRLISMRGTRLKRLLVEIPSLISAGVEIQPEYIELLKK